MADTPHRFPIAEFTAGQLDSLTWYDLLPGDRVSVVGDDDPRSAAACAAELLDRARPDDETLLDLVALKVLNGCSSVSRFRRWPDLAYRVSEIVARNLMVTGSRSLRMRAQRLNFYLQAVIDDGIPIEGEDLVLSEHLLPATKPWDYLRRDGEEWWISSDQMNIHRSGGRDGESHWRVGLPTQIDPLPDGLLAFGSLYTPGAAVSDGRSWSTIDHDSPVVLVFVHEGCRYLLDHSCRLYVDRPRELVARLPRPQVHFARYSDGCIFVLDNSDFGHLTIYRMATAGVERIPILPVQVANDIAVGSNALYMIDKQQGGVFKFSKDWRFQQRVLRFGRGPARVQDPVSIRIDGDRLLIVSWLNAKLTELEVF